ncbi:hypothetical protein [Enterovibrio coralii]|uniref:Uncharacterized protein n=1 Tax=Enterovibrio coralii TaxID=294935 RepID=A0A135I902_9GAMM|nr:hypothetical protein [Enterovibrio coralii]KXF81932.1 hypothetical protein ATN88_18370 [Enterovibrio coralii]
MGKALKVVGAVLGILTLIAVFLVLWTEASLDDARINATPFIKESLPILTTWEPELYEPLFTEEARVAMQSERGKKIVTYLSTLGELKAFNEPELLKTSTHTSIDGDTKESAIFKVEALFEKGPGLVRIVLRKTPEGYRVHSINISSDAFME